MTNPIDPEKFMPRLLDLLSKAKVNAETDSKAANRFERLKEELQSMNNMALLAKVKLFDQTLVRQFISLERRLGKIIVGADSIYRDIKEINKALDFMDKDVQHIKDLIPLVEPMPPFERSSESQTRKSKPEDLLSLPQNMSEEWSKLRLEDRIHETPAMAIMRRTYEELESIQLKLCFLSFSIFPEGSVMKKRPLIYWWIGEGFIESTEEKTAEELGEEIYKKLMMRKGLIDQLDSNASPSSNSVLVNSCTMHPWIRRMLSTLANEASLFHFDSGWQRMPSYNMPTCRRACLSFDNPAPQGDGVDDLLTIFNVNNHYLGLTKEWLSKLKKVVVLQLGRWQGSTTYHIEVEDEAFLKGLGAQNKHLKYLSLRGISRITEIPDSILNLISLEILDLRACHNLETLPSDISSLRKLTHLDLTECYLLEGMPKGLEKLSSLQVLKGFLIGSLKSSPCRLGDLAKLKKLRRLSLHMGNEAVVQPGEFRKLKEISTLRRLKISWGVVSKTLKEKIARESLEFLFPPELEKLDLQGIPLKDVPTWLKPSQLRNLKKLYIRGGEFGSSDFHNGDTEKWTVEVLRLKYLSNLQIGFSTLMQEFPDLKYLEKINCHDIVKDQYNEDIVKDIVWSKAHEKLGLRSE